MSIIPDCFNLITNWSLNKKFQEEFKNLFFKKEVLQNNSTDRSQRHLIKRRQSSSIDTRKKSNNDALGNNFAERGKIYFI